MIKPGEYSGRHYIEYGEELRALKKSGPKEEYEFLLWKLIEATEHESHVLECGVAPGYYKELAVYYRKSHEYEKEVLLLERFMKQIHAPGTLPAELELRLYKAQDLLGKSRLITTKDGKKVNGDTGEIIGDKPKGSGISASISVDVEADSMDLGLDELHGLSANIQCGNYASTVFVPTSIGKRWSSEESLMMRAWTERRSSGMSEEEVIESLIDEFGELEANRIFGQINRKLRGEE